jgi:NADPH:quinone reductase-like Zn-dependent oxidoreductase
MTTGETARSIVIHRPGGYDRLELERHVPATPGPGEVRVRAEAVGVNYADCAVRWGVYKSARELVGYPMTPGFEFAGVVDAVGPDVPQPASRNVHAGPSGADDRSGPQSPTWVPRVGDRVFGVRLFGAYSSHPVAPAYQVFPIPSGWSASQAAAFPVAFLTAYYALFQCVRIPREATILVHSAAGGVGTALLQLARVQGWRVVGVVGSNHKVGTAREFGADEVIVRSEEDMWGSARRYAPEGYDAILDASGPETLKRSYEHLAPTGKLVVYGFHTMLPRSTPSGGGRINWWKVFRGWMKMPRINPLHMTSLNRTVAGFNLSFLGDRRDILEESMGAMIPWIDAGRIAPPQVTEYAFEDAASAHRAIESARTTGKLVLTLC